MPINNLQRFYLLDFKLHGHGDVYIVRFILCIVRKPTDENNEVDHTKKMKTDKINDRAEEEKETSEKKTLQSNGEC